MSSEPIDLTPAEKQLLRRFFHRHALVYMVAMAVLMLVVSRWGSSEEASPSALAEERVQPAEMTELREEVVRLTVRLDDLSARMEAAGEDPAESAVSEDALARLAKSVRSNQSRVAKVERSVKAAGSKLPQEAEARIAQLEGLVRSFEKKLASRSSSSFSSSPASPALSPGEPAPFPAP